MEIRPASSEHDWHIIKDLFKEYFEWVRVDQGIDLGFQGFEKELNSLPGDFLPPGGCMLIAYDEAQAAGCVGLRPFDNDGCEMKRMFIRPEYRGIGLGRKMAKAIIQQARSLGYGSIRLDTADTMLAAQSLYTSLGFKRIQPYYQVPSGILKRAVFMQLVLTGETH